MASQKRKNGMAKPLSKNNILNPLSGAPQGGVVNPGNPGKNDYLMKLQIDK
ncbi:MAG: hypothetical protein RQ753_04265 [Desulfurivibrionaceae bacterium]|nr:hypothetical protein [Desulfurivibrionaceae bacterium]